MVLRKLVLIILAVIIGVHRQLSTFFNRITRNWNKFGMLIGSLQIDKQIVVNQLFFLQISIYLDLNILRFLLIFLFVLLSLNYWCKVSVILYNISKLAYQLLSITMNLRITGVIYVSIQKLLVDSKRYHGRLFKILYFTIILIRNFNCKVTISSQVSKFLGTKAVVKKSVVF